MGKPRRSAFFHMVTKRKTKGNTYTCPANYRADQVIIESNLALKRKVIKELKKEMEDALETAKTDNQES
jgi:hypothetical protein